MYLISSLLNYFTSVSARSLPVLDYLGIKKTKNESKKIYYERTPFHRFFYFPFFFCRQILYFCCVPNTGTVFSAFSYLQFYVHYQYARLKYKRKKFFYFIF